MNKSAQKYRMTSDADPDERELAELMHEVAVDAAIRSDSTKLNLQEKIKLQITEALVREGFNTK